MSDLAIVQSQDIRRLLAVLNATNQQLSNLIWSIDHDIINPDLLERSREIRAKVNAYQLYIQDKYTLSTSDIKAPIWEWDVP